MRGFKDFVLRGNVVDLAVAVVIGAAFSAVVKAVVDDLVTPLVAAVGGAPDLDGAFAFRLGEAVFRPGAVIGAALNFLVVAAVVYFVVVLPVNRFLALRRAGAVEAPAGPTEDVLLLTEIRDLLRDRP